tara:strand:+ start:1437 stop:3680 length:2244 start_codon:yes stop_codon:yes gene_type:complete
MATEEQRREAKRRQAKARQEAVEDLNVDLMVPRADPVGYVAPETEQSSTNLRSKFSQPGFELAGQASLQGGGVVDVPDQMALYSEDGLQIPIPQIVQQALEFAGDFGAFTGGLAMGSIGYIVGGMADIAVKAGMSESGAKRLARDIMAMPDAFAGSLGTLAKPRSSRGSIDKTIDTFTDAEKKALQDASLASTATVDVIQLTPTELGTLLREASKGGRGSQAAIEKLAMEAKTNPEAAAAAARLGIDLPPDVLSDNPLLKNAAAMTRDLKASEAAGQFETIVINASNAADEAMATINGSPDLSTISERVLSSLTATQAALKKGASDLYKLVDEQVPKSVLATPNNTVKLLNNLSEELGGIDNLSSNERLLFDKLTNPDTPLTYAALVRLKQDIGRGLERGQGPYGDVNQGALKRIYGALSEDQLLTVEQIGGSELRSQLRLANQTTAKQKAFEKRIVNAFGKDLEGSIASKLRQAISSGAKGDIAGLNRILKTIPKDLQREAIATAINALSLPGGATDLPFGFAQYAKTIKGLKKEKAIYNKIISVLGPESDKFLTDLLNVSQRITEARGRVSQTGKANQAMILEGLTAENIAMRIWNSSIGRRVVRGAAAGSGVVSGGPAGGAAADLITDVLLSSGKTDRVAAAGNLLNSAAFKSLVDADFAANQVALQTALDKLENSPAFKRWLKSVEMTPSAGRNLLQISIVAGADEGEVAPVAEEPVAEVDISQSPALQSLIETTNPALIPNL